MGLISRVSSRTYRHQHLKNASKAETTRKNPAEKDFVLRVGDRQRSSSRKNHKKVSLEKQERIRYLQQNRERSSGTSETCSRFRTERSLQNQGHRAAFGQTLSERVYQ